MFKIAEKYPLNTSRTIFRVSIEAPLIARAAKPGQFAIFQAGRVRRAFPRSQLRTTTPTCVPSALTSQPAGKSTQMFSLMEPGDYIADIVGPLAAPRR